MMLRPDLFIGAQAVGLDQALEDLKLGLKRGHWMWFVFPQAQGLGNSERAKLFGLDGTADARAYYRHPILGDRLLICTRLLYDLDLDTFFRRSEDVDRDKIHASMTLFDYATLGVAVFGDVLRRHFDSKVHQPTLDLLFRST